MRTVPQCRDYPALGQHSHAPTLKPGPADPSRLRGLTPATRALCRLARAAAY